MATRGKLAFKSEKHLQERIEEYFKSRGGVEIVIGADGNKIELPTTRVPTMSGLALFLGLSRKGLINYATKDEYSHVYARARQRIEEFAEEALYDNKMSRGAQFNLEVNHDWKEPGVDGPTGENENTFTMNQIAPVTDRKAVVKFTEGDTDD